MSWSREQVVALIDAYKHKQQSCLYVVKSPQYKNKHARNVVLETIKEKLLPMKADVTVGDIKNKFAAPQT